MPLRLLLVATLLAPAAALPNDGFYQGAGSTLMPVKTDAAMVLRETLHIRPVAPLRCYSVLLNGKPVKSFDEFPNCDITGFNNGPRTAFGRDQWGLATCPGLITRWSADATYHVEALATVSRAQIGFPVPTWGRVIGTSGERCDDAVLPGVNEFKTFVDGHQVAGTHIRELLLDSPPGLPTSSRDEKTLGFVWSMRFEKGRQYTLRTTYDFGVFESFGWYEGREFPKDIRPWFLPSGEDGVRTSRTTESVFHLDYILSPIRTWAEPPPRSIQIRVDVPPEVPVIYFVPVKVRPSCVDNGTMYFDIENKFPSDELNVTYPSSLKDWPTMATVEDWSAWRASLGGDAKLTCGLRDTLAKGAPEALAAKILATPCVATCRSAGK